MFGVKRFTGGMKLIFFSKSVDNDWAMCYIIYKEDSQYGRR